MIYSDRDLKKLIDEGRLVIEPFDPDSVQPSSIDLRVGNQFRVFANSRYPYIDVKERMDDLTELVEVADDEAFILHPGEFVLGSTLERVALPDDVVGRLEGKSSLGRLGLLIHSSLPGDEPVLVRDDDGTIQWRPIEEVVRKELGREVVSFDPETLAIDFAEITGRYEGPPDRIFEVMLESGRSVRVTAGHNLFVRSETGGVRKARTAEVITGAEVAIPPAEEPWLGDGLMFESVVEVRDTGEWETIFDLEVRPDGRKIENFLAGRGGIFVSNTAGYVDPGFAGYLTLELSNVANLPITIYPGMRIGQLSIFQMTSPAENPYGSGILGSKYKGQEGPTPSRYYENFSKD